jgi:hypothetical protein
MPETDRPSEAFLRQLILEMGRFIERRGGMCPSKREVLARWHQPPALPYGVWGTPAELTEALNYRELLVSHTIELIGHALSIVLRYAESLQTPAIWADEQGRLQSWLDDLVAGSQAQRRPTGAYSYSEPLAQVYVSGLSCSLDARWILSSVAPQRGLAHEGSRTTSADTWDLHLEVALVFLRSDAEVGRFSARRMDVLVFWGGEQQRLKLPRKVKQRLHDRPHERPPEQLGTPLVEKRLYIPEGVVAQRNVRAAVEDLVALLCFYLVQEELVRLEDNRGVREWLFAYLGQFKAARQLGVEYALGEIVTHYQIPEDYRALRKYVAKTIHGLAANQRRQEGLDLTYARAAAPIVNRSEGHDDDADILDGREEPMPGRRHERKRPVTLEPSDSPGAQPISAVAAALGMSVRSLYGLVARGKVQTETVTHGRMQYRMIPEAEVERLKEWLGQKEWRKDLIKGLASVFGITTASARRWVERQEAQGLRREAIVQRVRARLQRQKRGAETDE